MLLNVFFCTLSGYSLAKFRYPGKNLIFASIMGTIMVPFNVIVVPLYLIIRQFGWIDTYQALIVPFAMSAFGIFLMRQFIVSIPDDYIAAARVDGASEIRIFLEIDLPLVPPGDDHAGDPGLRAELGRVSLAAGGGEQRRLCAPCRSGCQVSRPVPEPVEPADGRGGGGACRSCCSSSSCNGVSRKSFRALRAEMTWAERKRGNGERARDRFSLAPKTN